MFAPSFSVGGCSDPELLGSLCVLPSVRFSLVVGANSQIICLPSALGHRCTGVCGYLLFPGWEYFGLVLATGLLAQCNVLALPWMDFCLVGIVGCHESAGENRGVEHY